MEVDNSGYSNNNNVRNE